ncbi:hypothetical protein FRC00_010527 [Tulasnella sp. 408]|nr:hypothetical protein FRC00_010527 [Tulasnella sp. 408]
MADPLYLQQAPLGEGNVISRFIARLRGSPLDEPTSISRRDAGFVTIPPPSFREELEEHIASHGGIVIYLSNALRLAICLALLGISIYAAIVAPRPQPKQPSLDMATLAEGSDVEAQRKSKHGKHGKPGKHKKGEPWFSHQEWVEIAQCVFYRGGA